MLSTPRPHKIPQYIEHYLKLSVKDIINDERKRTKKSDVIKV